MAAIGAADAGRVCCFLLATLLITSLTLPVVGTNSLDWSRPTTSGRDRSEIPTRRVSRQGDRPVLAGRRDGRRRFSGNAFGDGVAGESTSRSEDGRDGKERAMAGGEKPAMADDRGSARRWSTGGETMPRRRFHLRESDSEWGSTVGKGGEGGGSGGGGERSVLKTTTATGEKEEEDGGEEVVPSPARGVSGNGDDGSGSQKGEGDSVRQNESITGHAARAGTEVRQDMDGEGTVATAAAIVSVGFNNFTLAVASPNPKNSPPYKEREDPAIADVSIRRHQSTDPITPIKETPMEDDGTHMASSKSATWHTFMNASLSTSALPFPSSSSPSLPSSPSPSSFSQASLEAEEEERQAASNLAPSPIKDNEDNGPCEGIRKHKGYADTCSFVKARASCSSGTLVEYLRFHFCTCEGFPVLSYLAMVIWVMALFFMLGNTAADYFCPSLERISDILHLAPTVAGVTLLPLGNGAPDVFASIASFIGAGAGQVGLNSVLGGGAFVTAVVVGLVTFAVQSQNVRLDRSSFIRDVGFYMLAILVLLIILLVGRVTLWGALAFLSLYVVYAITVASSEFFAQWARNKTPGSAEWWLLQPFTAGNFAATDPFKGGWMDFDDGEEYHSLLDGGIGLDEDGGVEEVRGLSVFPTPAPDDVSSRDTENALPQWMWTAHVAIFAQSERHADGWDYGWSNPRPLWGWMEEDGAMTGDEEGVAAWAKYVNTFRIFLKKAIAVPLIMPRRLTIPSLDEERWSRRVFVASASLSPLMFTLATVTRTFAWGDARAWTIALLSGTVMGALAMLATRRSMMTTRGRPVGSTGDGPPDRLIFPWVCLGFVMSIVWFYVLANELVAALVAIGSIIGIDAAILGVTFLAWGNSIGDVVSNLTLAKSGAPGAQMAISASYAGPMFNCLIGIGTSLVLSTWRSWPNAFVIPMGSDGGKMAIFLTMAFLLGGMLFAALVLLMNQMRPTKGLGVGLLLIYSSFMTLRLLGAVGVLPMLGIGHVS